MNKEINIITHDSGFHTDDIFAVATLLLVLGDHNIKITRTRDMEVIGRGDYVVDVGGIYDSDKNRFDHHQNGGAGARENTIPYASFGLVWKKFGEGLCGSAEISNKLDQVLVQWVDAMDNGIETIDSKIDGVYPYTIGSFFQTFNPSWQQGVEKMDDFFMNAVGVAKDLLLREISRRRNFLETDKIMENIYRNTEDKRLIILDKNYPCCESLSRFPEPLFAVYPRDDGSWSLKAVRDNGKTFCNRKNLPKEWGGKAGEELEKETGVSGAVFCHIGLFLAVNKTKEGALKMAEIALNS